MTARRLEMLRSFYCYHFCREERKEYHIPNMLVLCFVLLAQFVMVYQQVSALGTTESFPWIDIPCLYAKEWELELSPANSKFDAQNLTNWLIARQNSKRACADDLDRRKLLEFNSADVIVGPAAEALAALKDLFHATALGIATKPPKCQLPIHSVGCFTEPICYCGFEEMPPTAALNSKTDAAGARHILQGRWVGNTTLQKLAGFDKAEADALSPNPLDMCDLAILFKVRML
jgi:hypothetical protein